MFLTCNTILKLLETQIVIDSNLYYFVLITPKRDKDAEIMWFTLGEKSYIHSELSALYSRSGQKDSAVHDES